MPVIPVDECEMVIVDTKHLLEIIIWYDVTALSVCHPSICICSVACKKHLLGFIEMDQLVSLTSDQVVIRQSANTMTPYL